MEKREVVSEEKLTNVNIVNEGSANSNHHAASSEDNKDQYIAKIAPFFVWIIGAALFISASWNDFWPWLQKNWVPIVVIAALIVAFAMALGVRKLWRSATGQVGSIVLLGVPLVVMLVGTVWWISPEHRVSILRCVFLVIVVFLPALLYYLFVALRRVSLLQEYYTNLSKLGLFKSQRSRYSSSDKSYESEKDRQIRVVTYLQRFEAVYGEVPRELVGQILNLTDTKNKDHDAKAPRFHLYQPGLMTPEAIPVVVTTILIGLGWLLVLPPWEEVGVDSNSVLNPAQNAAAFAFLGAYFYSLQMLFRRFVRRDLRANAYVSISQRIILAVVGVWAAVQVAGIPGAYFADNLGKIAEAKSLLVIAFVIGAFPPIAWQVTQAAFKTWTGANRFVPSLDSPMPLRELDGLTVWHEGRLEEEDIENVQNMATADLVELMLNTRYPPDRLVDWVDQAMLYTQLGKNRNADVHKNNNDPIKHLQSYGIRTASSFVAAYWMSKSRGEDNAGKFGSLLPATGNDLNRIPSIVDALRTNPNLELVQHWNRTLGIAEVADVEAEASTPKASTEAFAHA